MATKAMFPSARRRAGMYESFYLRAVAPSEPLGVWIRNTAHKRAGQGAKGSVWCTLFDARRGRPFMHKVTTAELQAPVGGWIALGALSEIGPGSARGSCGEASWSLRFTSAEPELRHLAPEALYHLPLPRTKLTSPAPAARFDGVVELDGREKIELAGWPGMVGHNWGAEHAERWIWLHGIGFDEAPEAWIDVALGRVRVAGRMTPWLANGVLSVEGRRHRIGGMRARDLHVNESADGCELRLGDGRALKVEARATVPTAAAAGWRYADPDGGGHDVVNCSVAALELRVDLGDGSAPIALRTDHGGAYELGMRERDHGVPIAPFPDG
jgi:hypothetical protein